MASLIVVIGPWKAAIVFAERTSGLLLLVLAVRLVITEEQPEPAARGRC